MIVFQGYADLAYNWCYLAPKIEEDKEVKAWLFQGYSYVAYIPLVVSR